MTQEEKELLAKDIFSRAMCGLKVQYHGEIYTLGYNLYLEESSTAFESYPMKCFLSKIEEIKPYLRPMSSMTEEERNDFEDESHGWFYVNDDGEIYPIGQFTDSGEFEDGILGGIEYLNKNHFDYRGLIHRELALEAPEDMYKTK